MVKIYLKKCVEGLYVLLNKRTGTLSDWWELFRPFAYSASVIPLLMVAVMLPEEVMSNLIHYLLLFTGVLAVHTGSNIINEYYDMQNGIDNLQSDTASTVLLEARIDLGIALFFSKTLCLLFLISSLIYSVYFTRPGIFLYGLLGVLGGYYYTAPPLHFKYRGLSTVTVFVLFGILLPQAVYYTFSGQMVLSIVFLPHAFLVTAIVFANNLGDRLRYTGRGDRIRGAIIYLFLLIAGFMSAIIALITGAVSLSPISFFLFFTAVLAGWNICQAFAGIKAKNKLYSLDKNTAALHLIFGLGWIINIII